MKQLEVHKCAAITRGGQRCKNESLPDSDFCHLHTFLATADLIQTVNEQPRYDLAADDLARSYQRALQDPYLLHLRDEIAVLDTRTQELLRRTDTGISAEAWGDVKKLWRRYRSAVMNGQKEKALVFMDEIDRTVEVGSKDAEVWRDIERLFALRRDLVEAEQKYLVRTNQTVPIEQVLALLSAAISAMKESVRKYVVENEIAEAIIVDAQFEYGKLVGVEQA